METILVLVEIFRPDSRMIEDRREMPCLVPFHSHRIYFKTHNSEGLETTREGQRPSKEANKPPVLQLGRL